MTYRFATDTGGTFTDLIVEETGSGLSMYKAATTPSDPVRGVLDALELAAADKNVDLPTLLSQGELFVHGTTHAINAIVTGNTAKTAFLTTQGHPDILTIREGGRSEPFNYTIPYPRPYIPRSLTFQIAERIDANGAIVEALDEKQAIEVLEELRTLNVEAIAVCFLWSVANSVHEQKVGELIERHLPDVPYTLSHQLNQCVREYRRASSTAIDASLKPLMSAYLGGLTSRLSEAGFAGDVLVLTSQGGAIDAEHLARNPIHAVNSGPSMAPLAGRYVAAREGFTKSAIIADTGGTTYDVSLVRDGAIPWSPETWIGPKFRGHMTGFPSIDVRSLGAGGGSIAWVDEGGMLHMGPQSAGSVPGPACYGGGGELPTFTDACLVLGYLDADLFLGGAKKLDLALANRAIESHVATPLGLTLERAAFSMVDVITENMVQAINEITLNQGVDPSDAVLIGGGGAAGLNSVWIAQRLGCKQLIIPSLSAALSASGALISDLTADYRNSFVTSSDDFDFAGVAKVIEGLKKSCESYAASHADKTLGHDFSLSTEARYENQVWEIEVPIDVSGLENQDALQKFLTQFHAAYKRIYAVNDPHGIVEFVNWIGQVRCRLRDSNTLPALYEQPAAVEYGPTRRAYFPINDEALNAALIYYDEMPVGKEIKGPAIVESSFTTTVLPEDVVFVKSAEGNLVVNVDSSREVEEAA